MKTMDILIEKYQVRIGELELRQVEDGRNNYEGVVL